jgi:hypothetical protein
MKNLSRKDDLAFTRQGIGETPRTDEFIARKIPDDPFADHDWAELCRQLERELNQAIRERNRAQASLRTLIALHQREIETGQPITRKDWEIAGCGITEKKP